MNDSILTFLINYVNIVPGVSVVQVFHDTRNYCNMRSKARNQKLHSGKKETSKKTNTGMLRGIGKQSGESVESVLKPVLIPTNETFRKSHLLIHYTTSKN